MKAFNYSLAGFLLGLLLIIGVISAQAAEKFNYNGPTITLRYSHFAPATHKMTKAVSEPWIKMVEEESNGKVRIQAYLGGTLHGAKDGFKACINDITDFTAAYTMYQAVAFTFPMFWTFPLPSRAQRSPAKWPRSFIPSTSKKNSRTWGFTWPTTMPMEPITCSPRNRSRNWKI